jgi:hypothetical protein
VGKNKDIRIKIKGFDRRIASHEEKIAKEEGEAEPQPRADPPLAGWNPQLEKSARAAAQQAATEGEIDMPAKTKNPPPSLDTFHYLMDEGEDYMLELIRLWHKMKQAKRGSATYFNRMAEVEVAASVVHARMESIMREGDAITDAMPDDD